MPRPTRQTHTLRTWSILGVCVLAGAILVSQVFSTPARAATDGIPPSGNAATTVHGSVVKGRTPQLPTGAPAIRLLKTTPGPITRDDVVRYVTLNKMPRTLSPSTNSAVTSASLLTSAEISNLLHGESTGFPDGKQLWFVQVRGIFVFPGPPGTLPLVAHLGYEVFDPDTGNLLMFGGLG